MADATYWMGSLTSSSCVWPFIDCGVKCSCMLRRLYHKAHTFVSRNITSGVFHFASRQAWQGQAPIHFKEDVFRVSRGRFKTVILSDSEESLPGERFFAIAQNDSLESASADSQYVFFEMYCPQEAPLLTIPPLQIRSDQTNGGVAFSALEAPKTRNAAC